MSEDWAGSIVAGVTTTTTDEVPPRGDLALIRARRSDTGWIVGDVVTTRFGYGATLAEALTAWLDDLTAITELEGPFGPPLDREVEWARAVLTEGGGES